MLRIWKTRTASFLMSVIFGVMAITQPARAFAPVAVIGAPVLVTTAGGWAMTTLLGTIGLVGMYLTVDDAINGDQVRIPMTDNPAYQPPAPTAPPTAVGEGQWTGYFAGYVGLGSDAASACSAAYSSYPYKSAGTCGPGGAYVTNAGPSAGQCRGAQVLCSDGTSLGTADFGVVSQTGTVCGAGYTLSGGSCVLTDARQAQADGKRDVTSSGGAYSAPADADNVGVVEIDGTINGEKIAPIVRNQGKVVHVPGKDSSGRPVLVEVERSPDGTLTYVRHYVQDSMGGQSVVTRQQAKIDTSTGQVTEFGTATYPGTISSPGTGSIPQTSTAAPDSTNTSTVTTTGEQVQPQPEEITVNTCGLPNQPACQIDDTAFANPAPQLTVPDADLNRQKTEVEAARATDPGFTANLVPQLLPGGATSCTPLQFRGAVSVGEVNVDSTSELDICWVFEIIRAVLGYLAWLVGVIYVWRRFTFSNSGAA